MFSRMAWLMRSAGLACDDESKMTESSGALRRSSTSAATSRNTSSFDSK